MKRLLCLTIFFIFISFLSPVKLGQAATLALPQNMSDVSVLGQNECENFASSSNMNLCSSLVAQAVESGSTKKQIKFADTDEFYAELAEALPAGEKVEVVTPFLSYSDFPPRLKRIFQIKEEIPLCKEGEECPVSGINSIAGILKDNALTPRLLNTYTLILLFTVVFIILAVVVMQFSPDLRVSIPLIVVVAISVILFTNVTLAVVNKEHQVKFYFAFDHVNIEINPIVSGALNQG